jgi:hypothetical protein
MTSELRKMLTRVGLIVLAGLAAAFLLYHFITGPSRARKDAAVSNATAVTAEGQKAAAQDTVKIIVDNQAVHGQIDVLTKSNEYAIRNSVGADEQVGAAVHNAGIYALCLRDTYRLQPACGGLLNAGSEGPAD